MVTTAVGVVWQLAGIDDEDAASRRDGNDAWRGCTDVRRRVAVLSTPFWRGRDVNSRAGDDVDERPVVTDRRIVASSSSRAKAAGIVVFLIGGIGGTRAAPGRVVDGIRRTAENHERAACRSGWGDGEQ